MKSKRSTLIHHAGVALLASACWTCAPSARAQLGITWGPPTTLTADSDVSTLGTSVLAYTWSSTAATVNGVPFKSTSSEGVIGPQLTLVPGWISYSGTVFTGGASAPFNTLSTAYQSIMVGGVYDSSAETIDVQFSGLTPGHTYLIQFWVQDGRGGTTGARYENLSSPAEGNTVTLVFGNPDALGGVGEYSIGTFIANETTQLFTVTAVSAGGSVEQMNALQLRDLGFTSVGFWNGIGGSAWDTNTTANWSVNNYAASLTNGTFSAATAVSSNNAATFSDFYYANGTASPVTQNNVTIAAGGVSGISVNFAATNLNYTINSADTNGITGATDVNVFGTANVTLTGTNTYTGPTTISSGTLTLSGGTNVLPNTSAVNFTGSGVLNLAGTSQSLSNLTITPNETQGSNMIATITGGGTLILNRPSAGFTLGNNALGGNWLLDMSGVSNFVYNAPSQTFTVVASQSATFAGCDYNAAVNLPSVSTITVGSFTVGGAGSANIPLASSNAVFMGQTTVLNANTITLGTSRNGGVLAFEPGVTNGSLTIRNAAGTGAATVNLGNINSGGQSATRYDRLDTTGGTLDALIGNMIIGYHNRGGNADTPDIPVLTMGGGSLIANNVILAQDALAAR